MELHSRITYYITNICFKELTYVEHWHGKVESTFPNYDEFKNEFISNFNTSTLLESFPHLFADDDDEFEQEKEEERERLNNLLGKFYHILLTVSSGMMDETPSDYIINNFIIPYVNEH